MSIFFGNSTRRIACGCRVLSGFKRPWPVVATSRSLFSRDCCDSPPQPQITLQNIVLEVRLCCTCRPCSGHSLACFRLGRLRKFCSVECSLACASAHERAHACMRMCIRLSSICAYSVCLLVHLSMHGRERALAALTSSGDERRSSVVIACSFAAFVARK